MDANNPNAWTYEPDTTRRVWNEQKQPDTQLRGGGCRPNRQAELGIRDARPIEKQRDGRQRRQFIRRRQMASIRQREGLDREGSLPAKAEGLATRDKERQATTARKELVHGERRFNQMLEGVEHDERADPAAHVGVAGDDAVRQRGPARRRCGGDRAARQTRG